MASNPRSPSYQFWKSHAAHVVNRCNGISSPPDWNIRTMSIQRTEKFRCLGETPLSQWVHNMPGRFPFYMSRSLDVFNHKYGRMDEITTRSRARILPYPIWADSTPFLSPLPMEWMNCAKISLASHMSCVKRSHGQILWLLPNYSATVA